MPTKPPKVIRETKSPPRAREEKFTERRVEDVGQPSVVAKVKNKTVPQKKKKWEGLAFSKVPLIIFAVIVGGLIIIAWLKMERSKKGAARERLDDKGIVEPEHVNLPAPQLRNIATKAKVERDWFKALRYLWASILVELEATGRLRVMAHATNLELVASLRGPAKAQALFGFLAGTFDLHFYGKLEVLEDDFRECEGAANKLRQVLRLDESHMTESDKRSRVHRVMTAGRVMTK